MSLHTATNNLTLKKYREGFDHLEIKDYWQAVIGGSVCATWSWTYVPVHEFMGTASDSVKSYIVNICKDAHANKVC